MIFQQFNLMNSRTVAGNVEFPLIVAGWDKAKRAERVAELLDFVGLADKAKTTPTSSQAARSSASVSPAPSPPRPPCCSPTNPPAP